MPRRSARRPGPALRLIVLAALLGAGACGTEPNGDAPATAIEVTGPTQRIAIGATAKVTAVVESGATPLGDAKVAWTSRDTTTATVDANGTVTALRAGEAWVVGTAGTASDSTLVEVAYAAQAREGRVRIRTGFVERSLVLSGRVEPIGVHWDYLGRTEEDYWEFEMATANRDTVLAVLLPQSPDGSKLRLADLTGVTNEGLPDDELGKPVAVLDIGRPPLVKVIPLTGYVEVGVDETVPASLRLGLTRVRLVGRGNAWRSVSGGGFIVSAEVFDVVADLRPAYLHLPLGASAGALAGTQPDRGWTLREAFWGPTTSFGRASVLQLDGQPAISAYLPGTATVELGPQAETARGLLTVRDSTLGYSATAAEGRVSVTQYAPPAAADLFGEIRGTVAASGVGTLGVAAPASFTASFDFDVPIVPIVPIVPSAASTAAPGSGSVRSLLERALRLRVSAGRPRP